MRILYTPRELIRLSARYPCWLFVAAAIWTSRLWLPDFGRATELGSLFMGISCWAVQRRRQVEGFQNFLKVICAISAFLVALVLMTRGAMLVNGRAVAWQVVVDFTIGGHILFAQLIVAASAYVHADELEEFQDNFVKSDWIESRVPLVTDAD